MMAASQAVLGATALNTTVEALAPRTGTEPNLALAPLDKRFNCHLLNKVVRIIGTSHITYDYKLIMSSSPKASALQR